MADPTIDWAAKYEKLRAATLDVLNTQQEFFKTRDKDVLRVSKAKEKALREMLEPKPAVSQATLDWLAK
ncbi:MAG TPA: hypothetical protein PLY79_11270 [Ferruginibacter sp.]|nr:hypothetical protein [Ferruginibacter sp.]